MKYLVTLYFHNVFNNPLDMRRTTHIEASDPKSAERKAIKRAELAGIFPSHAVAEATTSNPSASPL